MASVSHANKLQRQDTGVVTSSTKKPLLNLFANRTDCKYTPCYCEENVWKLCAEVRDRQSAELQSCYVVFVSNDKRTVPLWRQRAGKEEEKPVIWDYHVLFLYAPDDRCLVYDLDSELPFPTHFHKYVTETFRTDHILNPDYFRYFRVLPAPLFLLHFSSDRRHMKRPDGSWMKPPPDYPPISESGIYIYGTLLFVRRSMDSSRTILQQIGKYVDTILTFTYQGFRANPHNLEEFINMDPTKGHGEVMNLTQLVRKFYHQP